jgi:Ca2+-binding EF-hand superfamily protein
MFRVAVFISALTVVPTLASAQCTSDARQVVDSIYRQVLERASDRGSDQWVDRLAHDGVSVREVVRQIAKSPEHTQRWGNESRESVVRSMYKHILNREPDGQALRTMSDVIARQGPSALVDQLVNSQEYQRSFNDWVVPGTGVRYCANASQQSRSHVGRYRLPDNDNVNDNGNGNGVAMRFRRMDTNNDGVIQRNEWRGNTRSFDNFDANRDGVLSGDEVAVSRGRYDEREDYIAADERFDYLDVNGNGAIERNEWDGGNTVFDRLDTSRDGRLSRAEFDVTARSSNFASLDMNRDGRIALNEWPWTHRSFDQQDANRDGNITRDEFRGEPVRR